MNFPLNGAIDIYVLALVLLLGLIIESFLSWGKKAWSIPAFAVYTTVGIWYCVEVIYTPERFEQFSSQILSMGYVQVILFLVTFRLCISALTQACLKNHSSAWRFSGTFNPGRLLVFIGTIWICLLGYGIYRLDGNVFQALFPITGRAGLQMWGRAAKASAGSGFIVSSASYIYLLVCSFIGVLLPLPMSKPLKALNITLACLALPYFIFMGARNILLAATMPGYFSYTLFSADRPWKKILISVVLFVVLNQIMILIISARNIGFSSILFSAGDTVVSSTVGSQKHLGLNMFEELCYINQFYQEGVLNLTYGGRYLTELANIIPRAIWANKPSIGIEYAVLRGFGGASNDIGVFATVSTGLIGQGFYNFGPFLGPMAAGSLMALWCGWLSRLWLQRYSVLRMCLFLVGLGLTFNMGREITLLVLWPIVFGYLIVRFLEYSQRKRQIAFRPFNGVF